MDALKTASTVEPDTRYQKDHQFIGFEGPITMASLRLVFLHEGN
jgi:hypothetical protein